MSRRTALRVRYRIRRCDAAIKIYSRASAASRRCVKLVAGRCVAMFMSIIGVAGTQVVLGSRSGGSIFAVQRQTFCCASHAEITNDRQRDGLSSYSLVGSLVSRKRRSASSYAGEVKLNPNALTHFSRCVNPSHL